MLYILTTKQNRQYTFNTNDPHQVDREIDKLGLWDNIKHIKTNAQTFNKSNKGVLSTALRTTYKK